MGKKWQSGMRGTHLLFITPLNEDCSLDEQAVRNQV